MVFKLNWLFTTTLFESRWGTYSAVLIARLPDASASCTCVTDGIPRMRASAGHSGIVIVLT